MPWGEKTLKPSSQELKQDSDFMEVYGPKLPSWMANNRLRRYRPYLKQAEFHAAGARYEERLFMAGNQLGKTLAGAYPVDMQQVLNSALGLFGSAAGTQSYTKPGSVLDPIANMVNLTARL